ncbi:MAG: DUF4132 domain-containing protein [Actinomycetota bacterium]|nr:DUF4132 domain-containing protein [Actinomycetota bacterium]
MVFRRMLGRPAVAPDRPSFDRQLVEALIRDATPPAEATKFSETEAGRLLAGAGTDDVHTAAIALVGALLRPVRDTTDLMGDALRGPHAWAVRERMAEALSAIQRRKPSWSAEEVREALRLVTEGPKSWWSVPGIRLVVGIAELLVDRDGVEPLRAELERLRTAIDGTESLPGPDRSALLKRVSGLLGADGGWQYLLTDGDDWSVAVKTRLAGLDAEDLTGLLGHLAMAKAKPSARWLTQATARLDGRGARPAIRVLVEEIARHEQRTRQVTYGGETWTTAEDLLDGPNAEIGRGAIWAAALAAEEWVTPTLRDTAAFCGTDRSGGATARSEKLANACIGALGLVGTDDAVTALAWLDTRIKNRSVRKQLDGALRGVADRTGLSPSQLLERTVPSLGLDERGERIVALGDHVATLRLEDDKLVLTFATAAGRALSSAPAAVREHHGPALKELKALVKDGAKAIGVERTRLEGLLAVDRTWGLDEWRELYLRHPLTGHLTRRLLWEFDDVALLPSADGTLVDRAGTAVEPPAWAVVRLWHPIRESTATIADWRSRLMDGRVRQPFKQAFREVYRLTPAERRTEVYSNRFAGHILNYPQANALIRARGWKAAGLGYWDGGGAGEAFREFPDAGLRAVFYYDAVEQAESDGYGTPSLCSTDQVRFERLTGRIWARVPLAEVPALVFTEAMRDVDLFVGVASIASDPTWTDRGTNRGFDRYWHDHSFGELPESAQTRRAALERLVPKTKIADRCEVTDRFLVVRGNVRTYKIHIGSANILMEPDDSYLCIVPARRRDPAHNVFLPFEEDGGRLSVIMSKAFLLAADETITDPSILSQLRMR